MPRRASKLLPRSASQHGRGRETMCFAILVPPGAAGRRNGLFVLVDEIRIQLAPVPDGSDRNRIADQVLVQHVVTNDKPQRTFNRQGLLSSAELWKLRKVVGRFAEPVEKRIRRCRTSFAQIVRFTLQEASSISGNLDPMRQAASPVGERINRSISSRTSSIS